MNETGAWITRLETEVAREMGQPVTAAPGGEAPDRGRSFVDVLDVPGARLTVAASREDVARLLEEGRVIEPGSADEEMVRELWGGILGSVAARLGGTRESGDSAAADFPAHPCRLQLGQATVRMALTVEAREGESAAIPESREAVRESPGGAAQGEGSRYDLLLEVELEAVLRFGSRSLELRELLELGPGDVVEMDRQVIDPVDLIVGDRLVARGEVVLVDGNFGLRVIEVAAPVRRLESVRCLG